MGLRNIPTDEACRLADLVRAHEGTVASRSLARSASASMTLFAFAAGESVSEERYSQDTLYHVVEGTAVVALPDRRATIAAGEVLAVPAGVPHAIEGASPDEGFKVLQLGVDPE